MKFLQVGALRVPILLIDLYKENQLIDLDLMDLMK
jgi:hypothetical protein